MPSASNSATRQTSVLLVLLTVLVVGAVWGVSSYQRSTSEEASMRKDLGQRLLTSMLEQETGIRGFAITRRESFLTPYIDGRQDFESAMREALQTIKNPSARALLARQENFAATWDRLAEQGLDVLRAGGPVLRRYSEQADERKRYMDLFRRANAAYHLEVDGENRQSQSRAVRLAVAVTLLMIALIGGLGVFLIIRSARATETRRGRERRYHRSQSEFVESMQVVEGEDEAHQLIKRHLERTVPDSCVAVLKRNNSDDRLVAATTVGSSSTLHESLSADARPRACVAVRFARPYEREPGADPLVGCGLCGAARGASTCQPLLVGGKVIGSVLIEQPAAPSESERQRVVDSVAQAAPVLANLRTLAIAENRALTDVLTGLPNRRDVQDTLLRMTAQSARSVSSLAVIALDLDRFKAINDRFGHDKGDEVLAAVGVILKEVPRTSDFAGRLGGEEFVVLSPDTNVEGAVILAEKLRSAVSALEIAGLEQVTASFGIALMPDHAGNPETLLRQADRALYAAKASGRDCVEVVSAVQVS